MAKYRKRLYKVSCDFDHPMDGRMVIALNKDEVMHRIAVIEHEEMFIEEEWEIKEVDYEKYKHLGLKMEYKK